ncbi:ATP-binding protein [Streptomyces sp. NPDC020379]|uniref:ATP-binding protein n=1 Tax=Streptomyces sp. NPDC020379 TaxID=3365071 RepID=UPI0037A600E3
MKQGTIKTLGVAALGVAFAATAVGNAAAFGTSGAVESVTGTAATTMGGLPIQQAAKLAPAGGPVVSAADRAIQGGILKAPSQAVDKAVAPNLPKAPDLPVTPKSDNSPGATGANGAATSGKMHSSGNKGLLGGLPTLPTNGLPLPSIGG